MKVPAPRYPYYPPAELKRVRGLEGPDGDRYHVDCSGVSLYYLGVGVHLPRGWHATPKTKGRAHACARCGGLIR